jgi:hypothetical protein
MSMGWIFSTFLVLETLVAILVLPVLLAAVCWLALRLIDNRGLYSVSPFLELAIAAGGLIEAFVLRSTGLGSQLAPDQIWAANDVWSINLQGLYETSLAPPVLAALGSGALSVLIASWPAASLWIMAYGLTLLPVVVVAGFAWRSPRALVAAVLFLPISMTSAVVLHCLIIMTYWVVHWLNFWALFVLVLLFQMRRHEGNDRNLLAP